MTFYLYEYNNYYNRIIKKQSTIDEYNENGTLLYSLTNTNFIPNDGIYTEHIINYDTDRGDYAVIVDDYTDTISSRWFVIESVRVRAGQYKLTLYRDVIADWYDDIVNAPMFIEKASARIGDPAIYNSENMTYNQIKTKETLLKDETNIPWIVGYIDRKYAGTSEAIKIPEEEVVVSAEFTTLGEYPYHKYESSPLYLSDNISNYIFRYNFYNKGATGNSYVVAVGKDGLPTQPYTGIQADAVTAYYYWIKSNDDGLGYRCPYTFTSGKYVIGEASRLMYDKFKNVNWAGYSYTSAEFTNIESTSKYTISAEEGKIIKAGDDYYRIHVITDSERYIMANIPTESGLGSAMRRVITNNEYIDLDDSNEPVYQMEIKVAPVYFTFEKIYIKSFEGNISSPTGRAHLKDAPYDMFAIPYGEIYIESRTSNNLTSKELGMKIAAEIQVNLGKSLYDIQLLPFAPFLDNIIDRTGMQRPMLKLVDNNIKHDKFINPVDFLSPKLGSVVIWLESSNFTKYIGTPISVSNNNVEFKVQNECDMYRLSSPNYNTSFEFSATKNNGVRSFRVDIAYKPVTPYIRVAPLFGGLYGPITDDARGLICGGDFSLSQVLNEWLEYQRNNKNFQDIFDRQIENLEIKNNISRIQEKWNVATGTISGATTGALSGAMMTGGSWVGAAAGAVAGGAASLAGGLADIRLNEKLRTEAIDYTKDQFGYELGNIQARPTGLTKISTFNPNNKIFPVLEYYTATDVEKEALRNKIKYNGMTIMRIGSMTEFLATNKTYIKGKLIRLEPTDGCDFHVVSTIANELYKGVFI